MTIKWVEDDDGDNVNQELAHLGRFHLVTWEFGSIHQAKVIIEYPHTWRQHRVQGHEGPVNSFGVGLAPGQTAQEAKDRMVAWVREYQEKGPDTPSETEERCFREYPTLYKTRLDVIESLWFEGPGNGYDWLDGAVFYFDREPPIRSQLEDNLDKMLAIEKQIWDLLPENAKAEHPELKPEPPEPTERPLPDDGKPQDFRWDSKCRLLTIPPDLRPEWRVSAIEAATVLSTRASDPKLRAEGERILKTL